MSFTGVQLLQQLSVEVSNGQSSKSGRVRVFFVGLGVAKLRGRICRIFVLVLLATSADGRSVRNASYRERDCKIPPTGPAADSAQIVLPCKLFGLNRKGCEKFGGTPDASGLTS